LKIQFVFSFDEQCTKTLIFALGSPDATQWLKSTYLKSKMADGSQNFQSSDHYNSAADCSVSLKFGTEFDLVTANTLQSFKVKESKIKVTA